MCIQGKAGSGDAAQFKQYVNRQAGDRDQICIRGLRARHPRRHCHRPSIRPSHDKVDLVVKIVQSHHWKAVCGRGMVEVVDRHFRRALLMGSMSFSCSNG